MNKSHNQFVKYKKIGMAITLLVLSINARAVTCSPASGLSATISSDCTALSWNSGDVIVNGGVTVGSVGSSNAVTIGTGTVGTITNSGTLAGGAYQAIYTDTNNPTVTSIVNTAAGTLTGAHSIYTYSGSVGSISNAGQFNATSIGVINLVTINTFENTGVIDSGFSAIRNSGTINSLTNSGSMTGASYGIEALGGTMGAINNIAGGSISGGDRAGIYNSGSISALTNSGSISTTTGSQSLYNGGTIGALTNASGGIISGNFIGIFNDTAGIITTLNNNGSIVGSASYGISNAGTITTLNNAQGSLTYTGVLPAKYNAIITSASNYGKLAVTSGTGTTTFGVYTGSTVGKNQTYSAVLSGVTASQIINKTGAYGGNSWTLSLESGSSTIWDLIFGSFAPSVANTNQSLVNTASALQGTYTLQNSVLANSFSYDCTVFGANDVCVSAGGRNTQVQAANGLNNTSALLIAAYRPHPNYRIGAYADQNLSVSNPGGTVNLGNNTPLIGLFAAWNERLDGTGTEVKISAAYGQKNTTITRSVVGSGTGASEAGSGSSTLNSQGAQATAKYGFGIMDNVIVSPYVGVRYTQNNMGGYTEGTSSSVTAPLTYSALNTNATTALAGVGASYRVIPAVMTFASAGVETDTNTANGTYSATNSSIGTLTPINFNPNPVKTRPTATVGAYYDIEKNQRVGITGIYRQEAYQAVSTTTVMATYTVGL
ncbi:autotransporter outer membrane beta-barrel domain-containing protein [Polynucleobacter paneuropaeus]|nr:autotransporter outer membrane beta-barrel domain-containing protein [Polynucleobacter paneuropaeus]